MVPDLGVAPSMDLLVREAPSLRWLVWLDGCGAVSCTGGFRSMSPARHYFSIPAKGGGDAG